MEFDIFMDYEERKKFGSSDVTEFQYCSLPQDTALNVILDTYSFWKKDSLYGAGNKIQASCNQG